MRQKSTFVGLFFAAAGIIVAVVLSHAFSSLFSQLRVTNSPVLGDKLMLSGFLGALVGLGAGALCFAMPKTKNAIGNVIEELNKVNWPSWAETKVNTMVVIATSVVAAMILGVFDITFGWLSSKMSDF